MTNKRKSDQNKISNKNGMVEVGKVYEEEEDMTKIQVKII